MKNIPLHSLILLVGPKSGGKSTYARNNFACHEIVSDEQVSLMLNGKPLNYDTRDLVFKHIKTIIHDKLSIGERVVCDTVWLPYHKRVELAKIARQYGAPAFYLLVDRPLEEKLAGTTKDDYISKQHDAFRKKLSGLLKSDEHAETINVVNGDINVCSNITDFSAHVQSYYSGITVIPDVHGSLSSLLDAVTWAKRRNHFVLFLGDVIDFGPKPFECIDIAYDLVMNNRAAFVLGNHERKIKSWLTVPENKRNKLFLSDGNMTTINLIKRMSENDKNQTVNKFLAFLHHSKIYVNIDNVYFAHACIPPSVFGDFDMSNRDRLSVTLGYKTSEEDFNSEAWVSEIPKDTLVIVGHDPKSTVAPVTLTNTNNGQAVFVDTGCGKGGVLTTADLKYENNRWHIENYNRH